jgi:hypothetical protein
MEIRAMILKNHTVKMNPAANDMLEEFWKAVPKIWRKVRFKKYLFLDAYLNAIGSGRMEANEEDAQDAITMCRRELVIRSTCFQGEANSRVGYYYEALKRITSTLVKTIRDKARSEDETWRLAQTEVEFLHQTRAYANNEPEEFARAWKAFAKYFLIALPARNTRGGDAIVKYIPKGD